MNSKNDTQKQHFCQIRDKSASIIIHFLLKKNTQFGLILFVNYVQQPKPGRLWLRIEIAGSNLEILSGGSKISRGTKLNLPRNQILFLVKLH